VRRERGREKKYIRRGGGHNREGYPNPVGKQREKLLEKHASAQLATTGTAHRTGQGKR